ncbi:sugar ABC transporter permease [Nocardioides sp.]|uniref:sugar ABC transporter permease n=1 Tax=Nocardioides sp. TaxID=35761 RepID=UPI000C8F8036|nr:sugar ABC transporter permease [Nocardioides sp.]MAS54297.1 ABC transporter permease [Pimelobacter sp.]MDE0777622.1 sugar ABC transporter permease [Nocardioides sp.]
MAESTVVKTSADQLDERLIANASDPLGILRAFWARLKGGDLGSLPVVFGLVVISIVFYVKEPVFLSSRNLVTITQFAAPVGIIALGIVLVLLLGEIDLSVGSVSGASAAVMAVQIVNSGRPVIVGIIAGILVGVVVGLVYAFLYTKLGVPSFVFSLAGLLAFQGVLLYVLGSDGTINLPSDSWLLDFARFKFLTGAASYVLVVLIGLAFLASRLLSQRSRTRAELSAPSTVSILVKAALLTGGLAYLTYYLNIGRGWSYLWLFFAALVVAMDFALRRTRWGRHVFAVGGNEEAARRSGIKVTRIYLSVFVGCSTLAAVGGILGAAQLTSVSQATGTTDTNLTAIAAAVIGGTSLFGGRGSAYSAMLGILVLVSISSGLNLIGVDSSVRFMVTGGVLLLAVAIDSVSRRARSSSGRG